MEITSEENMENIDLRKDPRMRIIIKECPPTASERLIDTTMLKELEREYADRVVDHG